MTLARPASAKTRLTRERLVEATRAEIAETGSFTAERVAGRAGSSPATFYSYFPSKGDALAEAFASVMADLVAFVERELSIERLLDAGLEFRCVELTEATSAFFSEHALLFRCALAALPDSRALREVYRRHEAESFECYRRFVERGQRAGQVRAGDVDAVARALLVLMQGLNNPLVVQPGSAPVRRELGRALYAYLAPDGS